MKNALTKKQRAEQDALEGLPDEAINLSDIPEITDWSGFEIGKFFRPVKKPVSMRLDADILDWLKHKKNYTTKINTLLRQEMMKEKVSDQTTATFKQAKRCDKIAA